MVLLLGLAQAELDGRGIGSELFVDTLGLATGRHLIERYAMGRVERLETQAPRGTQDPARLTAVLECFHAHVATPIRLETLAAAARLSPFHFCRLFKATTGLSPYQFQLGLRIQRAKRLLREPEHRRLSLARVASACGFSDQSHLTRHFKRLVGTTPARFAQAVR